VDFGALVDLAISKPARYLGNELGVLPRDWNAAWAEAGVRWALTYPEVYEVGASNLGHIILYSILNAVPGQLCDRAYLPAADLAARLRQRGEPLFAVESRRRLHAFDILGFSLGYELGATNIADAGDPDRTGFPQLTEEAIVEADPEIIVITDEIGYTAADVAARPGWGVITAVAAGNIVVVDDDIASRWGPRIVEVIELVAAGVVAAAVPVG
jgi:hypothetical protein